MILRAPFALLLLVTAGCCVPGKPPAETHNEPIASSTPRPKPLPVAQHKYDGAHPIPPFAGGGWHDTKGPHTHPYAPDPAEKYRIENEHHVWAGEPPP